MPAAPAPDVRRPRKSPACGVHLEPLGPGPPTETAAGAGRARSISLPSCPRRIRAAGDLADRPTPAPEESVGAEEADVVVGTVSLSPALFAIYVGEAEQHVADARARDGAHRGRPDGPGEPRVHARRAHAHEQLAHDGFESLADVAHALEKWLADAIDYPPEFTPTGSRRRAARSTAWSSMVRSIAGARAAARARRRRRGPGGAARGAARVAPHGRGHAHPHARRRSGGARGRRRCRPHHPCRSPLREPAPGRGARADRSAAPVESAARRSAGTRRRRTRRSTCAIDARRRSDAPAGRRRTGRSPRPFEAGKDQRKIKDDVDRDLLPIFLEEAREIVPAVSDGVRRWKATPGRPRARRRPAPPPAHAEGQRAHDGPHAPGRARPRARDARHRDGRARRPPAARSSRRPRSASTASPSRSSAWRAARTSAGPEPIEVPVSAVFEQQKDKPTPLAVIAAAAEAMAQQQGAAAGASRGAARRCCA